MITQVKINVSEKLFLKDPESSELGKKILERTLIKINEFSLKI